MNIRFSCKYLFFALASALLCAATAGNMPEQKERFFAYRSFWPEFFFPPFTLCDWEEFGVLEAGFFSELQPVNMENARITAMERAAARIRRCLDF